MVHHDDVMIKIIHDCWFLLASTDKHSVSGTSNFTCPIYSSDACAICSNFWVLNTTVVVFPWALLCSHVKSTTCRTVDQLADLELVSCDKLCLSCWLGPTQKWLPRMLGLTRGERAATAIPPPPTHPPPTPAELERANRGRTLERAETVPAARTAGEDTVDKSPAASAPAASKPVSRSRPQVPAVLTPRADGSFADQDTDFLRRARGGNLSSPNLSSRPLVLRPADSKYPPVVINLEGAWVRVSKPPGTTGREPATIPVAVPGEAAASGDPLELPDELWRDPSLVGSNTALVTSRRTQVLPISEPEGLHPVVDNSEPEEKEEEDRASAPPPKRRAVVTTTSTGRRQVYQNDDVDHLLNEP